MNIKLGKLWDSLHSSYWFIPTLMVLGAIVLSFVTITLDDSGINWIGEIRWTYSRGADGARAILSVIAGSMITVATTAFSITIVALQLASSQFGPRLIRNFIQDIGNQIVLGTFIASFIYCLLILRTIQGGEEDEFLPQISITVGILLAVVSLAVLIYFIHHAAASIQAENVIAEVGTTLIKSIERIFPEQIGHGDSAVQQQREQLEVPEHFYHEAVLVRATSGGYLQAVDDQKLLKIAKAHNLLLHLRHRPGKFIVEGRELVRVFPQERLNKRLTKKLNDAFVIGHQRTEQQDIEFVVGQLVEIAVRALSPGINDPFTAISCIDRIGAGLCYLAERRSPSAYRYDDKQILRVITNPVTFAELTDIGFNQIRQYGQTSAAVTMRLLEMITIVAESVQNRDDRLALLRHATMIKRGCYEGLFEELDHKDVEARYQAATKALRLA
ncbi:MAG: DUF2254 domain-containing protein [Elainellaceae cyanobacterium]